MVQGSFLMSVLKAGIGQWMALFQARSSAEGSIMKPLTVLVSPIHTEDNFARGRRHFYSKIKECKMRVSVDLEPRKGIVFTVVIETFAVIAYFCLGSWETTSQFQSLRNTPKKNLQHSNTSIDWFRICLVRLSCNKSTHGASVRWYQKKTVVNKLEISILTQKIDCKTN